MRIAAPMAVDPTEIISRVQARRLDRSEQAALVAAREAWADAGFAGKASEAGLEPTRVAVVIGTGIGGVTVAARAVRPAAREGPRTGVPADDPDEHAERPGGLRRARTRRAGRRAHHGQRVRVRLGGGRARARPAAPRPRRRRRRRRHRGVHPPAQHRRLRADARDVDAQRRPAARVAAVGQGPRRLRAR